MNAKLLLLVVLVAGAVGAWTWRAGESGARSSRGASAPAKALPHAWPPVRGQRYPDLELPDHRGTLTRLSSFEGKVIVVEPIGMACPACQAYAGAHEVGTFGGAGAQQGLPSFGKLLRQYARIDWEREPDLVYVHLLLYDMTS
ncbi:MAG: hypothetical protein KIT58_13640, partial [Planctomycetota bacterium]|nr:hypothetical protein [Planctomycetota bacterium]